MNHFFNRLSKRESTPEYFSQMNNIIEKNCTTPIAILNNEENIVWTNDTMIKLIDLGENLSWNYHIENSFVSSSREDFFKQMLISKKSTGKIWDVKSTLIDGGRFLQLIDVTEYFESFKHIKDDEILSQYDMGNIVEDALESLSTHLTANSIQLNIVPSVTMIRPRKLDLAKGLTTLISGCLPVFRNQQITLEYKLDNKEVKLSFTMNGLSKSEFEESKLEIKKESSHYFRRVEVILNAYDPEINIIKKVQAQDHTLIIELSFKNLPYKNCEQEVLPPLPYNA